LRQKHWRNLEKTMNKKQLIAAITLLATALSVEAETKDLDVEALEALHADLTSKKEAFDQEQEKTKEAGEKQDKVVLEFKAPYKRYSNGDVAGFDADVAERILKLKPAVAEEYQPKADEE